MIYQTLDSLEAIQAENCTIFSYYRATSRCLLTSGSGRIRLCKLNIGICEAHGLPAHPVLTVSASSCEAMLVLSAAIAVSRLGQTIDWSEDPASRALNLPKKSNLPATPCCSDKGPVREVLRQVAPDMHDSPTYEEQMPLLLRPTRHGWALRHCQHDMRCSMSPVVQHATLQAAVSGPARCAFIPDVSALRVARQARWGDTVLGVSVADPRCI